MISVVVAVALAGVGTVFGDVVLSDEFYRTVNTFLNLMSAVLVPLVVYKISQWNKDTKPKIEETKQQVTMVAERTEHLADWDGAERREDS